MESTLVELRPGQSLKIRTSLGETIEGVLLSYDQTSQCLLIQEDSNPTVHSASSINSSSSGGSRSVSFVRRAGIQELTVLPSIPAKAGGVTSKALVPPFVDFHTLEAKERAAVKKAEEEAELLRLGVTEEAMDLFAALAKTLPVAWDKTSILVMGEIRISSPYLPQSVTGGSVPARERVKMVLAKERERLKSRSHA